jgi:CHC2 zinc finger/Toprim-like
MGDVSAVTVEEIIATILPRLERINGAADNLSARCPFPDHEDRNASFSMHRKTGLWRCHGSCGRKGNAHQLARELGCLPVSATRRKNPATVKWGLDAAIKKYGVEVTLKATVFRITDHKGNECRRHARYHQGEPRFQFWDKDAGLRTYHAWVSWDLVREWGAGCGIAYVVEGDRDALTLAAHGWPGTGILGVEHFDHARRDIVAPLKQMGIGALVITPDNDGAGQRAAVEWMDALESDGFAVGVRYLPESVNGQSVKDTFDLYSADRDHFEDWMHELPVTWRPN